MQRRSIDAASENISQLQEFPYMKRPAESALVLVLISFMSIILLPCFVPRKHNYMRVFAPGLR